ncbi:DNA methyltransferase [Caulobacter phage CcrColossus]|uniref:DNA (cytosine-5-)-methyltransferase n=1 Tax=Caulobacter phage CcrColossus TaxID=1211640 RepID=K4JRS7_9CAUD|nr:DNA methyltransferase [Caulobacter phage CcrColossus]AFU88029.1 putative DNA cytosine methyltransferase [Caulobacter phage CcrColossus]
MTTFPLLTLGTLCSGVEIPSLAFKGLGFEDEPRFVADNAAFPTRFLKERHPTVPNLGDILQIDGYPYRGKIDALWASFPCQDFSDAGKKKGLNGSRGILTLAGLRIVDEIDPPVFIFENVKGLLSDDDNAFGQFLAQLCGEFGDALVPPGPPGSRWSNAGYVLGPKRSVAWRLLDAQHFGLAQSRPRLFVAACPRGGIDPRDILFEQRAEGDAAGERAERWSESLPGTDGGTEAPAYRIAIRGRLIKGFSGQQIEQGDTLSNCLRTTGGGSSKAYVLCKDRGADRYDIRVIMPEECEVLMGMPPGYTDIPGATRDQRLYAIGNSLAVPVVRFIGERVARALHEARA